MASLGSNDYSLPDGASGGEWLLSKGETGALIAAYPWASSPIGALANWPPHLRLAVNLMMGAGAPMALVWGPEYIFLYNDRYAEIIADKHPASLGTPGRQIFPEIWDALAPLFATAMSGEPVVIDDHVLSLQRHGELKPAYFSFSYNPIRDEDLRVGGFLAVVVESTSRVVREQERARGFDTVLSSINDFAYTFDLEGRFTYINKALLDLWGLTLEQAVGKNFFDLKYPDELAAKLQRQIQEVIAGKTMVRDETPYESPTGEKGYFEYIFRPVLGPDGAVTVVAGSTRDITRHKNMEIAALQAAKAKDAFLANLSHELRTPLNPVLLLATENAGDETLPPKVRADFKAITDHIAIEARLIDDLLDISRITHDRLALTIQVHALQPILLRTVELLNVELREKKLDLTLHFEAEKALVRGDEVRLHQVFANLLGNAVKFTPEGGRISLATRFSSANPGRVVVEITDTGIGLTGGELAKVFQPFSQGEHATDGSFGGLGLGLAIAQKLVELHHGSLSAQSGGRNLGATFTVELPVPAGPQDLPSPSPAETPRGNAAMPLRILLVEDHASSREVLARVLAKRMHAVVQAGAAAEALACARAGTFDLVISDIGLPDQSGYELMAALRAQYGLSGIALSGYGMKEDIAQSTAAGFTIHLTKPVQTKELDQALEDFAARRSV
jgi:PAS domain S-box-containing protein